MATGIYSWSQTAASNNTADSNINWAEGQTPGSVNGSARAMMGVIAQWRDDLAGVTTSNGLLTSGGSANAQTLTTNASIGALTNGWTLTFRAGFTNTTAMTFAPDSLTAKNVYAFGAALNGGEIVAGGLYTVVYQATGDRWDLVSPPNIPSSRIATAAQIQAATDGKLVEADILWAAAEDVSLTDGASIAVDLSTGWNFALTLLATGHSLANVSNGKAGQSGVIKATASGGNYTLGKGSKWLATTTTWNSTITIQNGNTAYIYYSVDPVDPTYVVVTGVINAPSGS